MSAAQDEVDALFAKQRTRQTAHPEDSHNLSDHSSPSSDTENTPLYSSDEDEKHSRSQTRKPSMPSAVYHLPSSTVFDANTGPKGVIADAKSFDRARKRSFRQTFNAFSQGLSDAVFGEKAKSPTPPRSREKSMTPDHSGDEDDAEFMRIWRENRMNEMQATKGHDHRTRRLSPSKRRYGAVVTVDPLGYLDSIERVAAETIVVVMIYDGQVRSTHILA
jgi:hypothetical protein